MDNLIVITTDFGDSFAASQLKAVVSSLGFTGRLIENHDVTPFSITEGAFQIQTITKFAPAGTVFLGVIDPGVGSDRAGIIIQTASRWFVGPDNGLLYPAAAQEKILGVWKIQESGISEYVSNTFHGRDVFIKAAVYLAQGKQPEAFHSKRINPSDIITLSFQPGQVLHVDHYGNIKIHWNNGLSLGKTLTVKTAGQTVEFPVVKTFSEVEPGDPLALWGSSETLELAVNLGNAAAEYAIKPGEIVSIMHK